MPGDAAVPGNNPPLLYTTSLGLFGIFVGGGGSAGIGAFMEADTVHHYAQKGMCWRAMLCLMQLSGAGAALLGGTMFFKRTVDPLPIRMQHILVTITGFLMAVAITVVMIWPEDFTISFALTGTGGIILAIGATRWVVSSEQRFRKAGAWFIVAVVVTAIGYGADAALSSNCGDSESRKRCILPTWADSDTPFHVALAMSYAAMWSGAVLIPRSTACTRQEEDREALLPTPTTTDNHAIAVN